MATTRPPHTVDRARRLLLAGFLVLVAAVLVTRILSMGATAQALVAATTPTPVVAPGLATAPARVGLVGAAHPGGAGPGQGRAHPGQGGRARRWSRASPSSCRSAPPGTCSWPSGSWTSARTPATKSAADTYTIAIQIGAILAVVVLYFGRMRRMAEGAVGKDPGGRRSLVAIAIAFVPAAIVGFIGSQFIEDHLLKVGPVVAAWIVGALVIFAFAKRFSSEHARHLARRHHACARP